MPDGFTGGCLCGSVRFKSAVNPQLVGHCHCLDCRKSSGTGHCTNIMIPEDAFTLSGDVKFYDRPADSGNIVSRGFCPNCGSAIYSKNSGTPGVVYPRQGGFLFPENNIWATEEDNQPSVWNQCLV